MKIALLTLRYDGNYGGNLQRYALVTVLQRMGHEVEHLYIRDNWDDWFSGRTKNNIIKCYIKQIVKFILHPFSEPLLPNHKECDYYQRSTLVTEPFYNRYIPHTKPIFTSRGLRRTFKMGHYDAIIAGSDQIWRKRFVDRYGIGTFFMNFVPTNFKGKRIIYGASFGVDYKEYTKDDIAIIRPFFQRLNAVSTREISGLELLKDYGLTKPVALHVLDPSLLLTAVDYSELIERSQTEPLEGDMFCYIISSTRQKTEKIHEIAAELNLIPVICTLYDEPLSVEQWLRNIRDAKYIFTDSYHGFLFALMFHKRYHLVENMICDNSRFESIRQIFRIGYRNDMSWADFEQILATERKKSMDYVEKECSDIVAS